MPKPKNRALAQSRCPKLGHAVCRALYGVVDATFVCDVCGRRRCYCQGAADRHAASCDACVDRLHRRNGYACCAPHSPGHVAQS